MAYEILVLDIDGTLTTSEKTITKETLEAIHNIQERGHKVVLASGRPTPGIRPVAEELNMSSYGGYILSFNGARITDCSTNEIIYQRVISSSLLPEIYEAALEYNTGLITFDEEKVLVADKVDEYIIKEAKLNRLSYEVIPNFLDYVTFDVNKCLMTSDPNHLAEVELKMKERFEGRLNIFRSEPYFLEIVPMHVDKAESLSKLLEFLHLSKEQMISCGDGYNDITMIQYAGMGVAMANAQQKVKEVADYITLSNDNNGVAHVIKEFML